WILQHALHAAALRALIGHQSGLISQRCDGHDVLHRGLAPRTSRTDIAVSIGHELRSFSSVPLIANARSESWLQATRTFGPAGDACVHHRRTRIAAIDLRDLP